MESDTCIHCTVHCISAVYMLKTLMNHRSTISTHVGSCVLYNTHSWTLSDCFALQVALKCADIGHLAATPDVHKRWAYLLEEEFFLQVLLPAMNTICLTRLTVQDTQMLALTCAAWVLYGCCMYVPGLSNTFTV